MKKILLIIAAILIALVGGFLVLNNYIYNEKQAPSDQTVQEKEPQDASLNKGEGEPMFEWSYSSFTQEEIPRTTISLIARYENGVVDEREIDTIQGGCNEYVEPDDDVYENSKMIICFYAGLAHYFKVVESDEAYVVQRKTSEEARPNYSPEPASFETIAKFSK